MLDGLFSKGTPESVVAGEKYGFVVDRCGRPDSAASSELPASLLRGNVQGGDSTIITPEKKHTS